MRNTKRKRNVATGFRPRKTKIWNKGGNETVMFLYGRLNGRNAAASYCKLHKCYLEPMDISERHCNRKHCRHQCEI